MPQTWHLWLNFIIVWSFTLVVCTPLTILNQDIIAWSFRQVWGTVMIFVNLTKKMTLVPQTDNKLQRHLVSKFQTKIKSAAIQLKFGMVGGIWLLFVPIKSQPNRQPKNSSKTLPCLLWLLKPQMNVPLYIVIVVLSVSCCLRILQLPGWIWSRTDVLWLGSS